ncbi:TPA: hypothetical protein DEP26_02630 [Candidatus Uhrbacteria bacterium]|nr:hypothetical protein [Candidatus Uhrbacteria bacterium]
MSTPRCRWPHHRSRRRPAAPPRRHPAAWRAAGGSRRGPTPRSACHRWPARAMRSDPPGRP